MAALVEAELLGGELGAGRRLRVECVRRAVYVGGGRLRESAAHEGVELVPVALARVVKGEHQDLARRRRRGRRRRERVIGDIGLWDDPSEGSRGQKLEH